MFRALITAIALLTAATSLAETIPLANAWAMGMPGTREISKLDPGERVGKTKSRYGKLTQGIRDSLTLDRRPAGPGFAASGTDKDALDTAYRILVKDRKPSETVSSKINLIFFSLDSGANIQLESVERDAKDITIRYRFIGRGTLMMKNQFAIIPVGVLPTGKYRVELVQLPAKSDDPTIDVSKFDAAKMAEDIVCKPFTFEVK